jgi:hypothetical protein
MVARIFGFVGICRLQNNGGCHVRGDERLVTVLGRLPELADATKDCAAFISEARRLLLQKEISPHRTLDLDLD